MASNNLKMTLGGLQMTLSPPATVPLARTSKMLQKWSNIRGSSSYGTRFIEEKPYFSLFFGEVVHSKRLYIYERAFFQILSTSCEKICHVWCKLYWKLHYNTKNISILQFFWKNPINLASFSKNLVSESCPRVHIAYPVRKYSQIGVLWESIIKIELLEVGGSLAEFPGL